ncbi:putative agmatine deiminase [Clytia hemisphaerica]|uniref:Uncharacterized protein n=1 Tax=Clytia hemisphaerica TaxID=252671 RepID=A0A7M5WUK5_9CNID
MVVGGKTLLILQLLLVILTASSHGKHIKAHNHKHGRHHGPRRPSQLLVLAPPIKDNEYYKEKYWDVQRFYKRYSDAVLAQQERDDVQDRVVIVSDDRSYHDYLEAGVNENIMLMNHIDDPWVRDVAPPIPRSDVQFSYVGGSSLAEANKTQRIYDAFLRDIDVKAYKTEQFLLDGGNLVNNNKDAVITTKKFLTDNNLLEEEGVRVLQDLLHVEHVSILTPDEPKLAHSDGMAAYVCDDVIYQHKQDDVDFNEQVREELLTGCPHCQIVEVEGFLDDRFYKEGYASSCGVYVNCVVTNHFIYVPQFGGEHAALDEKALQQFENNPCGKRAVPINVGEVCIMGGSLRCLSWQTQGAMKDKVLKAVEEQHFGHTKKKKEITNDQSKKLIAPMVTKEKKDATKSRKRGLVTRLGNILDELTKMTKSFKQ